MSSSATLLHQLWSGVLLPKPERYATEIGWTNCSGLGDFWGLTDECQFDVAIQPRNLTREGEREKLFYLDSL
jgi:hypothetical protein